jgi:hypothetical protein
MPHSDRRHPDPQVSFHILLALRLIGDHLRATQDVRPGNSIADRVPTCEVLGLSNRDDATTQLVAEKIIELAKGGLKNPTALHLAAIKNFEADPPIAQGEIA